MLSHLTEIVHLKRVWCRGALAQAATLQLILLIHWSNITMFAIDEYCSRGTVIGQVECLAPTFRGQQQVGLSVFDYPILRT
jgi:hypothetical protein